MPTTSLSEKALIEELNTALVRIQQTYAPLIEMSPNLQVAMTVAEKQLAEKRARELPSHYDLLFAPEF